VLEPEAPALTRVLGVRLGGGLLLSLLVRVPVERLLVGELVTLDLDLYYSLVDRSLYPADPGESLAGPGAQLFVWYDF
jgi:hypothetical protein